MRLADLCELRVLGQESVAGVDGIGPRDLGRAQDVGEVEVAFRRLGGADADPFVREEGVEGLPVGFGENGDCLEAQLPAGADDPQGDLSAVGDEDFRNHGALACGLDGEQFLAEFDRLAVLGEDLDDRSLDVGFDLIHELHRLHNAERLTLFNRVADVRKRGSGRIGRPVEGPDHGGDYDLERLVDLSRRGWDGNAGFERRRGSQGWGREDGRRRSRCRHVPADLDLEAFDFELEDRQVLFLEEGDDLPDLVEIDFSARCGHLGLIRPLNFVVHGPLPFSLKVALP